MNSESPIPEDVGLTSLARPGSILARTARGAGWVVGWRMATRVLGIVNTLILVRLLAPSAFGLVALGYSFLNGLDQLTDVGIEDAIIRDDRPDRDLYDTGFTINFLRAFGIAAIAAIGAIPLAHFFHDSRLIRIFLVFAAMYALTSLRNIGTVDFWRYIAFDQEFKLKIIPRVISVVVAISAAFIWRSYWALVAAIVSSNLLGVILGYFMHPYRPRFSMKAWRRLAGFSFWMWVNGLIRLVREQAGFIVIGRFFNPALVGFYTVGSEVASLPTTEFVAPLCRACFPGFTEARQTAEGANETFVRLVSLMALVTLPAGFGISLLAYPIVKLGFGTEWLPAVPLVQILGIAGMLTVFGNVCAVLFKAHGWLSTIARISSGTTALNIILLVILVPRMGLIGAGIAIAVGDVARQVTYIVSAVRRLDIRFKELFFRVWRSLLATAIMTAVLYVTGFGWAAFPGTGWALGGRLLLAIGLGAAVYVVILLGTWRLARCPDGAEADFMRLLHRAIVRRGNR